MPFHSETALLNACRTLFGQDACLSPEFLAALQPSGARTAFRNQAKVHHPDAHAGSSPHVRQQQTERFREIHQAYHLLIAFLEKRHHPRPTASPPRSASTAAHWWGSAPRQERRNRPQPGPRSIPAIPLEFGMYSFYQGKITYQQLIEALVWQRRQRPALGVIAQQWGWLSETRVAQILGHRGQAVRFGKKAIELGVLKARQVEALLTYQQSQQKRIGAYFVEQGWLSEDEAEQVSRQLKTHNSQVTLQVKSRAGGRR